MEGRTEERLRAAEAKLDSLAMTMLELSESFHQPRIAVDTMVRILDNVDELQRLFGMLKDQLNK